MAIHPDHPGIEVVVTVDGRQPHEYNDNQDSRGKTIAKYIEATSNAQFRFKASLNEGLDGYSVLIVVLVDGRERNQAIIPNYRFRRGLSTQMLNGTGDTRVWSMGLGRYRDLFIVRHRHDLSDAVADEKPVNPVKCSAMRHWALEQVEVQLYLLVSDYKFRRNPQLGKPPVSSIADPVPQMVVDVVYPQPFVSYIFKYRTQAILRFLKIIPSPSASDKLKRKRSDENGMQRSQRRR